MKQTKQDTAEDICPVFMVSLTEAVKDDSSENDLLGGGNNTYLKNDGGNRHTQWKTTETTEIQIQIRHCLKQHQETKEEKDETDKVINCVMLFFLLIFFIILQINREPVIHEDEEFNTDHVEYKVICPAIIPIT